ncbi:MAG: VOC family protein [Magnetovibrio sp.]|nr:VOC family protein [Magnetovibrio sp.]
MSNDTPSILHHVSIGTNDFDKAQTFYDAVLAPLGCKRVMEFPGAIAYGREFPEFWVQTPIDGNSAQTGNGIHFGFFARSQDEVNAFHAAALKHGGTDDGAPGGREEYGDAYYGCFVRDVDGHKIEATYWDQSKDTGHT